MRLPKGPRASTFSAETALVAFSLSLAALVACSKPAISSTMNIPPPKMVPTATCPNPKPMVQPVTVTVDAEHHAKASPENIEVPSCTIAKIVLATDVTGYQVSGVRACKVVGAYSVQVSSGKATIVDHNTNPMAKGTWFYRITVKGNGRAYQTKDECGQDPPPSIHNQ